MVQLDYSSSMAAGFPGMKADLEHGYTRSYSATVDVPPGCVVSRAGADDRCKLPTNAGEAGALLGVALHSHTLANDASGVAKYVDGDTVSVLRKGTVYVQAEEAVAEGDPVYVRHTANGGNTQLGAVRKSADTGCVLVPGLMFRTSAALGKVSVLEINLP